VLLLFSFPIKGMLKRLDVEVHHFGGGEKALGKLN